MTAETKETNNKTQNIKRKKRKRRRLGFMKYVYLFIFVFISALAGLSYLVNSYSPKVDVSLGETDETLTLSDSETEVEMKTIDERLKWIQMEDEMPSVAIRETLEADDKELQLKKESSLLETDSIEDLEAKLKNEHQSSQPIKEAPKPSMSDIVKQTTDFRTAAKQAVIPAPIPSVTKVYLGPFSTLDEAIAIQQKAGNDFPAIMPFVKTVDGSFIVQIGSFSNKEGSESFIKEVTEKGYSPQTMTNN